MTFWISFRLNEDRTPLARPAKKIFQFRHAYGPTAVLGVAVSPTKDFTETVQLLCNLSHFVIVDITNPRSAPLELQATVPDYMVPFAPILQRGEQPFSMFVDLQNKYDWVLQPVVGYPSVERLIEVLEDKVVRPAEAKFNKLLARRTKQLRVENV